MHKQMKEILSREFEWSIYQADNHFVVVDYSGNGYDELYYADSLEDAKAAVMDEDEIKWENVDERIKRALKDYDQDEVQEYIDEAHDYSDADAYDLDDAGIRRDFETYLHHRS